MCGVYALALAIGGLVLSALSTNLNGYLASVRDAVLPCMRGWLSDDAELRAVLYELMLEYPLRHGKALRPALCIALCQALGGSREAALPTASVVELFHNAFLVHDDIEDESLLRRGEPSLHRAHGLPVAINVGDAMFAVALEPLLQNTASLGVSRALRVLRVVARMCRESTEGQALELHWIRTRNWALSEGDYVRMVIKKTGWYSFVAPLLLGSILSGALQPREERLIALGKAMGLAFQIQDDLLNLAPEARSYGKEFAGDLWEGKRTLIVLHAVQCLKREQSDRLRSLAQTPRTDKTQRDVDEMLSLIHEAKSIEYATRYAEDQAELATQAMSELLSDSPPSEHTEFLMNLVSYLHVRER